MTATKQYQWTEGTPDDLADFACRCLWVADGVLGHHRALADSETVEEALADYAAGYDAGGVDTVEVSWRLYEDGEEIDRGRRTLPVG